MSGAGMKQKSVDSPQRTPISTVFSWNAKMTKLLHLTWCRDPLDRDLRSRRM